jgi:hypothetical protein
MATMPLEFLTRDSFPANIPFQTAEQSLIGAFDARIDEAVRTEMPLRPLHVVTSLTQPVTTPCKLITLERQFSDLVERWRDETDMLSAPQQIYSNRAFLQILSLGSDVLPFIFRDLQERGGRWFLALSILTGQTELTKACAGDVPAMKEIWLKYARSHGYIESSSQA